MGIRRTASGSRVQQVEVHAFQGLADGLTMIVESGPARIIEVPPDKQVVWAFRDVVTFGNSIPIAAVLPPESAAASQTARS